jgi:hypothetical protein
MSRRLARRSHRSLANPLKRAAWKWIAVGSAAGAVTAAGVGYVIQGANNAPMPTAMTTVSNTVTGAGVGALVAGLASGLMRKNFSTALAGAAVGGLALALAFIVSQNPAKTA